MSGSEELGETWFPVTGQPGRPRSVPAEPPAQLWRANWFGPHEQMRVGRRPLRPLTIAKGGGLLVLGATGLLIFAGLVESVLGYADGPPQELVFTAWGLAIGSLFTVALFTGPSLLWVAAFYAGGPRAWRSRLALGSPHPVRDLLLGLGLAIPLVFVAGTLALLFGLLGGPVENPVVEAIGPALTWPVVAIVALSAGIGEEIFFRGLVQGRLGVVPANILFGLVHLDYGTPLQVLLPLLLGFVFSYLVIRTRSLYPAIAAHAGFDAIMLSAAKLADHFADAGL